jgi:adenine deaminase
VSLPDARAQEVIARLGRLVARLAEHGVEVEGASMTLSYLALRVISDEGARVPER